MKRILAIFKDLQDSGQQAAIVGYFSIQHGQFQKVIENNDAHVLPNLGSSLTAESKNPNRYTAEHDRDDVDGCSPVSSVALPQDLVEIIAAWPNLPNSVQTGILAMVKATASQRAQVSIIAPIEDSC